MDLPKRKSVRLQGYNYSQNGAYFLTLCTINRQQILCDIVGDGLTHVLQWSGISDISNYILPQIALTRIGSIVNEAIQYLSDHNDKTGIDQYVIMPNHVHLIVFIDTSEDNRGEVHGTSRIPILGTLPSPTNMVIPKLVSSLKRYTNKQCGSEIWQRSYYDHIIRNDEDYLQIWKYIEDNPLKWQEDELYL